MIKYKIKDKIRNLIILELPSKEEAKYTVQCSVCNADKELYGEAIYKVPLDYLRLGKYLCGCSAIPKWTRAQWEVILKRKAEKNNHEIVELELLEKLGQFTKLNLKCMTCNHTWNTCSIGNYIKDRGCPQCARKARGLKRSSVSEEVVQRFRDTGVFPESQYSFERLDTTSRLWNVSCTVCKDSVFVSDRSNLIAGKIPCRCGTGGGFDTKRESYFYILEINIVGGTFIKFGITNSPKRRITSHKRVLNNIGSVITKQSVYTGVGEAVLAIESKLKRDLTIANLGLEGFKKEACHISLLPTVLAAVSELQLVTEPLKL